MVWAKELFKNNFYLGVILTNAFHGATWRIHHPPALDYYDPVFMARCITRAEVNITRAGLDDYICPPSGIAILYKSTALPKKTIRVAQGRDHETYPKESEVIIRLPVKR